MTIPATGANSLFGAAARRDDRALLQQTLDRISNLPDAVRTALAEHQWSLIPLYVNETGYAPAQPVGIPLAVSAQTNGYEVISSAIVSLPIAATGGVLQLGSNFLPVNGGVTVLSPMQLVLAGTDVRAVTFAGAAAGPVGLWLSGQQLPTTGVLSR